MGSDNATVVRRLFDEVVNAHDVGPLDSLVAPDVVDHQQVIFAQSEEGIGAGLQMFFDGFPDFRTDLEQVVADGDQVAARFHLSGTNTGNYRGLPAPTQRHAEWDAMALFRIAGGRIAEVWGVADRMGMLTQLGILPDIG
jgi:predicted ester cyclase